MAVSPPFAGRLARALLALPLLAAACQRSDETAVRAVVTWDGAGLRVDQLEFSVVGADGGGRDVLVQPTLRPQKPAGTLPSPSDVVIRVRDDLEGRSVRCHVSALYMGKLQQVADSDAVTVRLHGIIACAVALPPGGALGVNLANGSRCGDDRQCVSAFCVDGVCCDVRCDTACMACDLPQSPGICSFVPEGTLPRDQAQCPKSDPATCGTDGMCDGHGACREYPAGTACAAGHCDGAAVTGGKICDGRGLCAPGPVVSCAPFQCDTTAQPAKCRETCTVDADCVDGRKCEAGSCGRRSDGTACTADEQCVNGHCADGLCCDGACTGACLSCKQPGFLGMCRPVAAGTPDPHGQCVDSRATDAKSCGASGACDGLGNCALYAAETLCGAAVCSDTTVMKAGTCDGDGVCQPGGMLRCNPFGCVDGHCNGSCSGDGECAPGQTCDVTMMSCGLKGIGQSCTLGSECASTLCVDGVCCNEACDGPCRSCSLASSMGICKNVAAGAADPRRTCAATDPSTCGTDGACDGNGACRRHPAGTTCTAPSCSGSTRMLAGRCDTQGTCTPGDTLSCAPYVCNGAACFQACSGDGDCLAPNVCLGGACGLRPLGTSCRTGADCASGSCTDGVCCESGSCGTCHACNVASAPGRCTPLPAAAADTRCADQGATSCGTDGKCDGAGSCRYYTAGTSCGTGGCSSGNMTLPALCDGSGRCVPGGQQTCAPYVCGAGGCLTMCTTNADCVTPNQCNGGSCGPKPLGKPCGGDGECASGHCTDGVCCDSASCSSCRACNVTGRAGSCQAVADGAADPRGVCVAQAPSTCGRDGFCDGTGSCRLQVAGTTCAPGTCSGNRASGASLCDGNGACVPPTGSGSDCGFYACRSGACLSSCNGDLDCAAPATCAGSVCRKKPLGASCSGGAECDSGSCVDGVCCGSASCTACKACNVPGFLGACSNVGAGGADPHGRCAASAQSTCGLDGFCDGAGACRNWKAGTVCAPAGCISKKVSGNPKTCDGAGTCAPRGNVACAPDDCNTATGMCP